MSSHCSVGGIGVCSQTAVAAAVFSQWTLPNIRSNRTWCAVCSSSSVSRSLTGAHCRYWGSLQLCVRNAPLCLTMKKCKQYNTFQRNPVRLGYRCRSWIQNKKMTLCTLQQWVQKVFCASPDFYSQKRLLKSFFDTPTAATTVHSGYSRAAATPKSKSVFPSLKKKCGYGFFLRWKTFTFLPNSSSVHFFLYIAAF